jgi:hypothetical protein
MMDGLAVAGLLHDPESGAPSPLKARPSQSWPVSPSGYFDAAKAFRRNHHKERVNLDLPVWMIQRIDRIAGRNGIPRQSQLKAWLAERLKEETA